MEDFEDRRHLPHIVRVSRDDGGQVDVLDARNRDRVQPAAALSEGVSCPVENAQYPVSARTPKWKREMVLVVARWQAAFEDGKSQYPEAEDGEIVCR